MENTTTPASYTFTLAIDPSTVSTAQQKKLNFVTKRIFSNPAVVRTKKLVALLARQHKSAVRALLKPKDHIFLTVTCFYRYPAGTPKKWLIEGNTRGKGADCDNLTKAPIDALGYDKGRGADLWDDDRVISTLTIKKRHTISSPRMVFTVMPDPDHIS